MLAKGERTSDVARKFGLSNGRISQIRLELAASWRRFVGDAEPPAAAAAAGIAECAQAEPTEPPLFESSPGSYSDFVS